MYNIRVRRGPLSGTTADGARLNIVAGIYEVDHVGDTLVFKHADQRNGGDIGVNLGDYVELAGFPDDIPDGQQIEIV